jgi:glycosyltransferase involved in cell wall biosynthesis
MLERMLALLTEVKRLVVDLMYMAVRLLQASSRGRELEPIQDNTDRIQRNDILLFATLRNEAIRIPFFLDYYRSLGVRHFLFVDNGSTDDFPEIVKKYADVSVWHTEASYRKANFGMHWLNYLLRRFGTGHWCITCDPDEFLVYPHIDQRNLYELTDFLDGENRRSLWCFLLDMYSEKSVNDTIYREGDDPFEVAPYFDHQGYVQDIGWLRESWVAGGVRRRVFFHDMPERAPSLNKIALVKWRWSYSYFLSMHQLVPSWLNLAHADAHTSPTGCLFHFKYFSLLHEKVEEEMERKEHWDNSFEYQKYNEHLSEQSKTLIYEKSARYRNWEQLVALGLMNTGQWF